MQAAKKTEERTRGVPLRLLPQKTGGEKNTQKKMGNRPFETL